MTNHEPTKISQSLFPSPFHIILNLEASRSLSHFKVLFHEFCYRRVNRDHLPVALGDIAHVP